MAREREREREREKTENRETLSVMKTQGSERRRLSTKCRTDEPADQFIEVASRLRIMKQYGENSLIFKRDQSNELDQ